MSDPFARFLAMHDVYCGEFPVRKEAMEFIIRPRRSGKTTDMLMWVDGHEDCVLVVSTAGERDRLLEWIKDRNMSIRPDQIITLSDRDMLRGRSVRIGIDNLDMLLYYWFGSEVELVAATGHLADGI